MRKLVWVVFLTLIPCAFAGSNYMGQYSVNPYVSNNVQNNPGMRYQNTGEYSVGGPKLYDNSGNFHGNLNQNRYDPDSVANPYGRYGSQYSQDSVNNPYGAGSRYNQDSPNNPYGTGLQVYGE